MLVKEAIERSYLAPLRDLLTIHVGEAVAVQVILNGAQRDGGATTPPLGEKVGTRTRVQHAPYTPDPDPKGRPDWISAERWETLPTILRATLIGSTLADGQVQAASPYLGRILRMVRGRGR